MQSENLNKYKKLYKVFEILGGIFLADMILSGTKIPFVSKIIIIPIADLLFNLETANTIIGLFQASWILFFIIAIILNRKIKRIEKANEKIS